ncbi:olfactory receptor 13G1 [Tupaia chinensis]|uniref:Olfactory receptor 13A1 n=1 Tax=Tupaia chinensis TaxID=246437 RepID=L9KWY7_TUPCH|nr:olfactory receptor 13G1 [Tupaia chinensis]ELW67331.1 Olfactory receptor 13A1 [Tupaia chinensis]
MASALVHAWEDFQLHLPWRNHTSVSEFVLQGFSEYTRAHGFLFCLFLALYLLALVGNLLITAVVWANPGLHMPMYIFLVNLALLDMVGSSTAVPTLLEALAMGASTISFPACMTQVFVFSWTLGSELLLFTVMAYDRYVAICHPLHYSSRMSPWACGMLVSGIWVVGMLDSILHTAMLARLSFCGPNTINHFFCEIPPILLLSCSPTQVNELMTLVTDLSLGGTNFLLTLVSYGCVIASILRIRSAEGKQRAFSTCSAHLIVVSMYYSAVFCAYISPSASYSPEKAKSIAVLYSLVSPALNPLIYTLRNKDVRAALQKLFARTPAL